LPTKKENGVLGFFVEMLLKKKKRRGGLSPLLLGVAFLEDLLTLGSVHCDAD
jgi:hypothetical protein